MKNRPSVGIGVIIIKDNTVLCAKRKGEHGNGTWGFLGGHLEYGESWDECARRETLEEVNISIKNIRFGTVTNVIFKNEEKHYISIIMVSDYDSGEVRIMEPDKFEKLEWHTWDNLPEPLFQTVANILIEGFNPFKLK